MTSGEHPDKGVAFFGNFERSSAPQALIEETAAGKGASSKCHIGSETQTAKSGDFNPVRVPVVDRSRFRRPVLISRVRCDHASCSRPGLWVRKGCGQMLEPFGLWNHVVVDECNNFGMRLPQTSISRPAEAGYGLNGVARLVVFRDY